MLRRTLQEVNIHGKQYDSHHSYMVPDGSRLETNSCCAQYSGTLCSWHAVQLKGNVLQILSQFWEKLLLAEPPLNPNPRMVWGTCQQECTQHNSRMESFKPSVDQDKVHTHSERTGFEQRSKIAATYHQLLALGRFHEEEFCGTHWFRCCGTVVAPLPHHWTSLRTVSGLVKGVSENYMCLRKHTMMRFCTPRLLCQGPYCK